MLHLLHHDRDLNLGQVDVWLNVQPGDLETDHLTKEDFKLAKAQGLGLAVIAREFGGTTIVRYPTEAKSETAVALLTALITGMSRPQPVDVHTGCSKW